MDAALDVHDVLGAAAVLADLDHPLVPPLEALPDDLGREGVVGRCNILKPNCIKNVAQCGKNIVAKWKH